ncbi:MAG: hypothetical protein JKY19_09740 [Alcanivoracaceae bacterium]|nr:hypothetical protein [Alcanivoracaceae bacterium]
MKLFSWFTPNTMTGQMIVVLSLSLTLLLTVFGIQEILKQQTVIETAESNENLDRIRSLLPVVETLGTNQIAEVLTLISTCHKGHTLTQEAYNGLHKTSSETVHLGNSLSKQLNLNNEHVIVNHVSLSQSDFSYNKCKKSDMHFPFVGLVISIKLPSGQWLNSEIHPHEWHTQYILSWIIWSAIAFFFIGGIAIFFISHLNKPLENLNNATTKFAQGLIISKVKEIGPPDIRRIIRSFNAMQQQVTAEIDKRTKTIASISHDIRTPLTALRIKAELIDDSQCRESLISSIEKMEKITASALEFLKGENRTEAMRVVDLSALLESECLDFLEQGHQVSYIGEHNILQQCRPDALARAVRNLTENAVKYAGGAVVNLSTDTHFVAIVIEDRGPGIPQDKIDFVMEPFTRLSKAREGNKGGFGLGLAIAKAIAEGHNTHLYLQANKETGLIASIQLRRNN